MVVVTVFGFVFLSAAAGTLAPSASPAATMYTLTQLYNAVASTFDSSGISANQNGSLMGMLKYINANMTTGKSVSSNSLDFDEIVASASLDTNWDLSLNSKNFDVGSGTFFISGSSNYVGVGDASPEQKLTVAGSILASQSANDAELLLRSVSDEGLFTLRASGSAGVDKLFITNSTANTSLLVIASSGRVGIGTTTPSATLDIQGDLQINISSSSGAGNSFALCHTSNGATTNQFVIDCGDIPSADYMEMYPTIPGVELGDIVMPSDSMTTTTSSTSIAVLTKATKQKAPSAMGIVSDITEASDFNSIGYNIRTGDHPQPIALSGRVRVKVIGSVAVGDRLALSDTPGIAEKATKSGMTVGIALTSRTTQDSTPGFVLAFVNLAHWQGPEAQALTAVSDAPQTTDTDTWFKWMLSKFSGIFNIVFEQGLIRTVQGVFDKLEVKQGTTMYDDVTGSPYCVKVHSGSLVSIPGPCGAPLASPTFPPTTDTIPSPLLSPSPSPSVSPESSPMLTESPSVSVTPSSTPEVPTEPTQEPTPIPSPSLTPTPEPSVISTPSSEPSAPLPPVDVTPILTPEVLPEPSTE